MSITSTKVVISTTGQTFTLPGAQTADQVKSMYGSSVPVINSMDARVEEAGEVRTITFVQRTGTKGAITSTKVVISTTGQTFTLPGAQTADQVKSMYGSSVPVINSMDARVEESGEIRTITFVQRTGTKG